jgi:hypothetical protein
MKIKNAASICMFLLLLVLLVSDARAMSSSNYRLDWFTPLTTGGGGISSSTNYTVNITIGQSVIGSASSAEYKIGIGYWYSGAGPQFIYLPLILRYQ